MTLTTANFFAPTAPPPEWVKGDEFRTTTTSIGLVVTAAKPNQVAPFAGPRQFNLRDGRRSEIYLVGSTQRNARFVAVYRANLPL
jgi:hypothetical protein